MLAKQDEISSTEKLLDLIRSENPTGVEPADSISPPQWPKNRNLFSAKIRPLKKKRMTVGVDVGYNHLKLVKIRQSSDTQWTLQDYTSVPFDSEMPKHGHEFATFLNHALTEFCGDSKEREIWCLLSSDKIEIRHIRIPKVPKKQVNNAVYWTAKKKISFDEQQSVLDFKILGHVTEEGIQKISVMVYTAPRDEIKSLKDLFSGSGFPLTGISLVPFAIQNLIQSHWLETVEDTLPSLYITGDWSRVDIFSSGDLVFTRSIKVGINSLIENIGEQFQHATTKDSPVTLEIEAPIQTAQARKVLYSLADDAPPLTRDDPGVSLGKEQIFRMILPALERLVRQIDRSLKHYCLQFDNENISKIYLSGEICAFSRIVDYISDQVELSSQIIDPFATGGLVSVETLSPESILERSSFAHAMGMALSQNPRTLNCIFTYKDKEKSAHVTRINRGIIGVFAFMMVICIGIVLWQGHMAKGKTAKRDALARQMEQYTPRINQAILLKLAARDKQNSHELKEYGEKYLGMAVIGEIARMTPSNIRLLTLTANLGEILLDKDKVPAKGLVFEGLVFGDQQAFDASLATYLIKLENSHLFSRPSIHNSSVEYHRGEKVLYFTVHMKLL
jgi:type IV pilus assembly protein PilM